MIGNIYISGQIGTFEGVQGVELVDIIGQVKKQPEATEFHVHINSEGGLVDVGFDIFNYLRSLGLPITTIGSGIVASIATVIFMAGKMRLVRENTPFMIHLPWGGSMGTADELEQFADELRAIENKLVDFYKKELNLEKEAILPLLKNETWLTPEQLTTLGFTNSQPVKAAAKTYFKRESNMNGTFSEKDRHWMEGLFTKVLAKFKSTGALNKVVQDANGVSIDFTELADDATPEKGQKATIDGKPAEGEYVMPSGETYVFTAGELTEIKPAEEPAENPELDAANARIAELEGEVAAANTERDSLKTQLASIKKDVLDLRGQIRSKYNPDDKKAKNHKKEIEGGEGNDDKLAGALAYLGKDK